MFSVSILCSASGFFTVGRLVLWLRPKKSIAGDASSALLGVFLQCSSALLNLLKPAFVFLRRVLTFFTAASARPLLRGLYAEEVWWVILLALQKSLNSALTSCGPLSDMSETG